MPLYSKFTGAIPPANSIVSGILTTVLSPATTVLFGNLNDTVVLKYCHGLASSGVPGVSTLPSLVTVISVTTLSCCVGEPIFRSSLSSSLDSSVLELSEDSVEIASSLGSSGSSKSSTDGSNS